MARSRSLPAVDPMPARVPARLPGIGAGLGLLRNPTGFFRRARERHGDTFVADLFGYRLFCVFSPRGLRTLYALAEEDASFGLATFNLVFKRKAPLELVAGRRNRPHDLFGSEDVEHGLAALENAVEDELRELGASGRFEIFAFTRRLGHRLGLACWAGPEAAATPRLDRLIPHLDRLDPSESFVRPIATLAVAATRKRRERRAMHAIEALLGEILREREASGRRGDDFLARIAASWDDTPEPERSVGIARDVIVIHLGAQSNLPAALGWTLANLLLRPELLAAVAGGDDDLLERCANESIRMAQRSLTLRQVMRPLDLDLETGRYRLAPGVLIATMLSVCNTSAAAGLEHFDPAHYAGRRMVRDVPLATREQVSTFGHGRHSCPAQRFSITAIRVAIKRLASRFELEPDFRAPKPRRRQLGGVARAEGPCWVDYRRR